MNNSIKKVNTTITFTFSDGRTYTLPLKNEDASSIDLMTYGTSISISEKLYQASGNNIVGNICCNSMNIELISKDKLLVNSNEESEFYGYMNDSAIVDVYCYVVDDDYTEYMGRYFVDTWENGATNSNMNEVSISCVDLLSRIKNISLGKIRLKRNIKFTDYLKDIVDVLNEKLADNMKILYDDGDIDIFANSTYDWQMYFNNIDRTDIESIFNCVAKDTISYIWIDRNRHIKTDHLLDDKGSESVSILSGSVNLFEYGSQSGDIDKYSGVNVSYISNISYDDVELLNLTDYELIKGVNSITNATLNNEKVYNIHHIEIVCETGNAICTYFNNYKNSIDMEIESTNSTKCSISVFGTVINETTDVLTMYKDDNIKSDVVEVENKILRKEIIPTYTNGLVQLMAMKNNKIHASGYINPRIKLGDIVQVFGSRLGINNYYKITGLDFTLGTNYRCNATLLRTIAIDRNVNSIMFDNISVLLQAVSGEIANSYSIRYLSANDEVIVQNMLTSELNNLNVALNGGV